MPELTTHYSPFRGCIQKEKWSMGPYAGADDECCRLFLNYSKMKQPIGKGQGVKQRYRLSWLTNSALVHEPKCGGGGVAGSQPMSTAVHMHMHFGDLTLIHNLWKRESTRKGGGKRWVMALCLRRLTLAPFHS
jgi:hypothetical protein